MRSAFLILVLKLTSLAAEVAQRPTTTINTVTAPKWNEIPAWKLMPLENGDYIQITRPPVF